jgi:hypothetical protein
VDRNRSQSASLPFPVGGENSRDPILEMDQRYAINLTNIFPEGSYGELRKGYRVHSSGMGSGAVPFLYEYALQTGARRLVAGANGQLYNASILSGSATSLGSGFSSNLWQACTYLNKAIFVNGVDQPQQYDGTTLSAANYTGIADDAKLMDVCVYKERLYFIDKDNQSFWYGATGTVTGALTEFEVGDFLTKGGFLQKIASWTTNTGSGMQDLLVLVSSEGEILTYSGTDPATDFAIEGRFFIPRPVGLRKCAKNIGADLFILHMEGVTSLGSLIQGLDASTAYTQFTDLIAPTYVKATQQYGSNTGWDFAFYPAANWAIINVPTSSDSNFYQHIMNTKTGAWCRFQGIRAVSWCTYNNLIYFGGTDGKVYQANYGANDNDQPIEAKIKFPFNYFNVRDRIKLFHTASAQIMSSSDVSFNFSMDVDGQDSTIDGTSTVSGAMGSSWDTSDWDTSSWADEEVYSTTWEGLYGLGRSGALKISGKFSNIRLRFSSAQVIYEIGGYL